MCTGLKLSTSAWLEAYELLVPLKMYWAKALILKNLYVIIQIIKLHPVTYVKSKGVIPCVEKDY